MTINELTKIVMEQAEAKGFGTKMEDINVGEKMALIHSEVSEALEAYRKGHGDERVADELGDIVQRVVHLAGIMNLDLEAAIKRKVDHNNGRDWQWDTLVKKK